MDESRCYLLTDCECTELEEVEKLTIIPEPKYLTPLKAMFSGSRQNQTSDPLVGHIWYTDDGCALHDNREQRGEHGRDKYNEDRRNPEMKEIASIVDISTVRRGVGSV